jgi:hypothetical protein
VRAAPLPSVTMINIDPADRPCDHIPMKTLLFLAVVLISASGFSAANDSEIAAIYTAVPSAKTITKTSDGFRVHTDSGIVNVTKSSDGFRVHDGSGIIFITKTSDGYRVLPKH